MEVATAMGLHSFVIAPRSSDVAGRPDKFRNDCVVEGCEFGAKQLLSRWPGENRLRRPDAADMIANARRHVGKTEAHLRAEYVEHHAAGDDRRGVGGVDDVFLVVRRFFERYRDTPVLHFDGRRPSVRRDPDVPVRGRCVMQVHPVVLVGLHAACDGS